MIMRQQGAWDQGAGSRGDETHVAFKPHLAEVIAAAERGESLPQPIRDKVIERAQSALSLIESASEQTEAEVAARTRSLAAGEGSGAILTCRVTYLAGWTRAALAAGLSLSTTASTDVFLNPSSSFRPHSAIDG